MPYFASSTRVLLSSFTASVEPSDVTAAPGSLTSAARKAAMESAEAGKRTVCGRFEGTSPNG